MSSRRLQDMSSRHIQDMPSRRLQDMSSRRLQDVFSITIFRLPRRLQDVLQDVFKTSLQRRLGRRKIVTLKTSSRPTNVCWELCNQSMAFKMIFKNFSDILMVQELLYFLEFCLQLLFVLLIQFYT